MPDIRSRPPDAALPAPVRRGAAGRADIAVAPYAFPVVGIGSSAGGLDACRKFLAALPAGKAMALILVQHLDPTHESMMVELLSAATTMSVQQATDGMPVAPDHVYVIPPGSYLAIAGGALHLSPPDARHGARLPFDFLLHALARECGPHAVCVILSGTGADGSLGLQSVRQSGGLVIAQDPAEALHAGMPQSAIATGAVDRVLAVADMPGAIAAHLRRALSTLPAPDGLAMIIEKLRVQTNHDFSLYKPGTLLRRIQRRMALAGIGAEDMDSYAKLLDQAPHEVQTLAKELLIHFTSFFRDPHVFALLAQGTIPDLVRSKPPADGLRVWVAGCSTGEETYSLAMLFREEIAAANLNIKLQVFASDVEPDAIAIAREGHYPASIEADVSPARLARFFSREDNGYRVLPELREIVVFSVQDVLADPPFSRLDFISCRNLLIYLRPEAQTAILSCFHFALRGGGILLLGNAETVNGGFDDRFDVIARSESIYRRIGRGRPGKYAATVRAGRGTHDHGRPGQDRAPSHQAALAELCQGLVMHDFAPAAVLVDRNNECLYTLGPTGRYLRVAPGYPTNDLLAMVPDGLRTRLRPAIQRAIQANARLVIAGGGMKDGGDEAPFDIDIQPVLADGERLLFICFVDVPRLVDGRGAATGPRDAPGTVAIKREIQATRTELQGAIRNLEMSVREQKAVNAEALSVNEEYQSANEELLTSKEELQSLNEELTALNAQLQETLERQRTTANDLQNVLYSTDVATIFLDAGLKIRFFTPATRALFNVIPGDIGRPLADLHSLAADADMQADCRTVLRTLVPLEREIGAQSGAWYLRRVMPYRTRDDGVEGVVITFVDITERQRAAGELEAARRDAELANTSKSRFLAAASHDLRQPLQALALLHGMLDRTVTTEKAHQLVERLNATLATVTGMLNSLLDINQIEAGAIQVDKVAFPINELFDTLREEFAGPAQAQGIAFRVVPCSPSVRSDPRLLGQMLRNLLSNAVKYTSGGKVLLGCRRRRGEITIEVLDTGIGIPASELQAIFQEYHQLDNPARDRIRGVGLGLSIVQRLSLLLGHPVQVRSRPGRGSAFAIEVGPPVPLMTRPTA